MTHEPKVSQQAQATPTRSPGRSAPQTDRAAPQTDRVNNVARMVIVLVSLLLAGCVLLCGGVVFWEEFWHVPRLVYTVLPTYVVRDQNVAGLVVENRGRQAAHQVSLRVINLDQPIETYTIKTGEQILAKEGNERNINVRLERIVPGSSVTLYVPTEDAVTLEDHLSISSEEGHAVPASGQQDITGVLALGLIGVIIVLLMIIGGIIGWVLARASGG